MRSCRVLGMSCAAVVGCLIGSSLRGGEALGDTVWSGTVNISTAQSISGTLIIQPGTNVTFGAGGSLNLTGGSTLSALGTASNPILFTGSQSGIISASSASIAMDHCKLTGVSSGGTFLSASGGERGVIIRNSAIEDCGSASIKYTPFAMTGCDVRTSAKLYKPRDARGFNIYNPKGGANAILIENNTVQRQYITGYGSTGTMTVRNNVIVQGGVSYMQGPAVTIEFNFICNPYMDGSKALNFVSGTIRNNVLKGGSWTTSRIGGTITGNVLEALSPDDVTASEEADYPDPGRTTHELICGLKGDSVVERNILLNKSYGAIMGIGTFQFPRTLIRNNTFDLRSSTYPVYINYRPQMDDAGTALTPELATKDVQVRNNLFLRTGPIFDDWKKGGLAYCDYNGWGAGIASRFQTVTMPGKTVGSDGFGGHDLTVGDPAAVVKNPHFTLPYTREEMLSRTHTVAEALALYRDAYQLKEGSPAINAGSPQDSNDPAVADQQCDLGALEKVQSPAPVK